MSRNITRASNEYLELITSVVTGAPLTISAWAKTDTSTTTDDYCIVQIQDASATNQYYRLNADGSGDTGSFAFVARASSTGIARTTVIPTVGQWYHLAAMEIASNSRRLLVDGGSAATGTSNIVPSGIDSISIGRERDSSADDSWSGDLAEIAVWDAALTDEEVAILAAGYSALFVRPQNLVFYTPLIRDVLDRMSGSTLTLGGSPSVADHPPIIYPSPHFPSVFSSAAPSEQSWIEYVSRFHRFSNIRR